MSDPAPLLEKASRSLQAAERLLREGDSDFAASRTYYAYFYVARALLLTLGLDFSRHGQIVSQFGHHFSKTERLPQEFHQLLIRAFNLRQIADYQVEVIIESEIVAELVEGGQRFLAAAARYLEQPSASPQESNE